MIARLSVHLKALCPSPFMGLFMGLFMSWFGLVHGARAETVVVKTGECEFTVTVKIVIAGPLGTQAQADKMTNTYENLWNGPKGEDASVFASNLGMETRSILDTDQGPESLPDDREKIDAEYDKYLAEFGYDESCAYLNCCKIIFKADIRLLAEGEIWPAGYHYIEIVADDATSTKTVDGQEIQVPVRSYVNMHPTVENPDVTVDAHWRGTGPGDNSVGKWRVGDTNPAEAHEMGHLMGLDDQYIEEGGSQDGHAHDLMTDNNGFPFEDAMLEVLSSYGMDCDCCPDEEADSYWQALGLSVLALGDAVQLCDQAAITSELDRLRNQRKELREIRIAPSDMMQLASSIDAQIAKAEAALKNCPPKRPVTGSYGDDLLTYIPSGQWALPGLTAATDSTLWCTYGTGVPEEGTPTGGPEDGDDPRDAPPPEATPTDGDDPRDAPGPDEGGPQDTPEDGDDPRDTPRPPGQDGGDDPRDAPTPGGGFDPNDLPEIDLPGTVVLEDDDDDPKDTPVPEAVPETTTTEEEDDDDEPRDVPVFVKAKTALLDGAATGVTAGTAVAGQVIKFLDTTVTDMALPSEGGTKVDTAYAEDPLQCTTDANGNCKIDVPDSLIRGDGVGFGSDMYTYTPGGKLPELLGIEFEVTPTQGQILKVDAPAGAGAKQDGAALEDAVIGALGDYKYDYTASLSLAGKDYYSYGNTGYGAKIDWNLSLGTTYDYAVVVDYCRDKQPGPPLGWEPADYDEGDAVASAVIHFDAEAQP